jgi:hypothetical protein
MNDLLALIEEFLAMGRPDQGNAGTAYLWLLRPIGSASGGFRRRDEARGQGVKGFTDSTRKPQVVGAPEWRGRLGYAVLHLRQRLQTIHDEFVEPSGAMT